MASFVVVVQIICQLTVTKILIFFSSITPINETCAAPEYSVKVYISTIVVHELSDIQDVLIGGIPSFRLKQRLTRQQCLD